MSDTATLLDAEVAAFAAAIRTHLDDLPAEDVDDLTGGLEADLLEQASDHDGTLTLGDPELYAAELRASAGFPERSAATLPKRRWRDAIVAACTDVVRRIRSTMVGAWVIDFAIVLRPAWWLLRGWAVYELATLAVGKFSMDPLTPGRWPFLLAAVFVSVQWGRGKWLPASWLKAVRTLVSIVTALALPFLLAAAINSTGTTYLTVTQFTEPAPDQTGLWIDGARVSNIFAYDAEGNPLTNVQLFNQIGEPLTTVGSDYVDQDHDYFYFIGTDASTVPFLGSFGGRNWNVFPLDVVKNPAGDEPDLKNARAAAPPFAKVPSLPGMPTPSAGPSAAPPTDPAGIASDAAADAAANAAATETAAVANAATAETQPTK